MNQFTQRGFSLIEVMVSLLILAIGIVAGLGMTQAGQNGLEAGRRISHATGLAQAMMEEEVSISYAELLGGNLEGEDAVDGFRRTWTVSPDRPGAHWLTIQITVEWKDRTGRSHQVRLVTLRAEGVVP